MNSSALPRRGEAADSLPILHLYDDNSYPNLVYGKDERIANCNIDEAPEATWFLACSEHFEGKAH